MELTQRLYQKLSQYPPVLWLLAIGSFLNVAGSSFLWPMNSVYIHNILGKSLTVAGIVLLLNSAAATIGQLVGGGLFDRLGARIVLLVGLLGSSLFICIPAFLSNWSVYILVMVLYGFTGSFVFPTMYALAAKCWPEGGRRAFNFIYVANNLGVAAGTALGGLVAQYSFRFAFLSASITFFLFAVFVYAVFRGGAFQFTNQDPIALHVNKDNKGTASRDGKDATGLENNPTNTLLEISWTPILALYIAYFVLWIVYVQWQSSIAVHLQDQNIPLSAYSVLWTINGIVIFCGQPILALIVRYLKTYRSQMLMGVVFFLTSFGLLYERDSSYLAYIFAMVLLTLGEMLLWPVIPAAVAKLSPPSKTGFLQGFIGSAASFGRMLGPLVGGLIFDNYGFHVLIVIVIGIKIVPIAAIFAYQKCVRENK